MGIGALYVRRGLKPAPLLIGGGQQAGRRAGTLPTALCVGLGAACRIAGSRAGADAARLLELREQLYRALAAVHPGIRRNGAPGRTLAGCLHVTLPEIDAADLLIDLPDLALSTGSACGSGSGAPSHVLTAMGVPPEQAFASIRFGLGRTNTEAEIDRAARRIAEAAGLVDTTCTETTRESRP
jgi:cysteine desulfurase